MHPLHAITLLVWRHLFPCSNTKNTCVVHTSHNTSVGIRFAWMFLSQFTLLKNEIAITIILKKVIGARSFSS